MRKILKNLVPNPRIIQRTDEKHHPGVTLEVPKVHSKLRKDSFIVRGPLTFNIIPKELRSGMLSSLHKFHFSEKAMIQAACNLI